MKRTIALATLSATLAIPATAGAHVTLQPDEAPAGDFTRMDVRVPNERDNAGTTKVDVRLPSGFIFASYEPEPGWDVKVTRRKLDKPIESHGARITEEVGRITWIGDGKTGIIRPGEFQDFGLSVGTPDKPGATLVFKAIQTYENGEVVRWIGPPEAEEPAPQVRLRAAEGSAGASDSEDDGAPVWLVVVALGLGVLGLLAGIGGLMSTRRSGRPPSPRLNAGVTRKTPEHDL
jgi:periplasmic copper chaperone A